jgi:hypothetical protein
MIERKTERRETSALAYRTILDDTPVPEGFHIGIPRLGLVMANFPRAGQGSATVR